MESVRVRFAPSPTGFFHIGSARTALFNWLYARHTNGTFILRIEDTDQARNTPEALRVLFEGMRWLGMNWDEGPEVGGDYGPYFQSERSAVYAEYRDKLIQSGHAYEAEGALWFRVSGTPAVIDDAVRGRVERLEEKDFVIFRSDGNPVFHFVNVVDDIAMRITHVIRGEDHLSNTSKHIELFNALGAPIPQYAHIPLILKDPAMGKGKMSKRDRGALIEEYEQRRFSPSALVNFLCLLGWNPKDNSEIMSIEEVISRFDLPGINKDNARFDEKKLMHINTEYLRRQPAAALADEASRILQDAELNVSTTQYLESVIALCQPKLRSLEDLPSFAGFFFTDAYVSDEKAGQKLLGKPDTLIKLTQIQDTLAAVSDWNDTLIHEAFDGLAARENVEKPFGWFPLTRFAVSGQSGGVDLIPLLVVLGRQTVLARIESLIAAQKLLA
jgi:glutamyl-tRNA synthetase